MKRFSALIAVIITMTAMSGSGQSQTIVPDIEGPYLGQEPPGSTPKIFAPDIVNTDAFKEIEGMFGADMNIFYFVRRDRESTTSNLIAIEYDGQHWRESIIKEDVSEPSISPDGATIYIQNEFMERSDDGWSELKSLGQPLRDIDIMRLSGASSGAFYFDTYSDKLDIPLRYSRRADGKYEEPKSLGPQFAIGRYNAHPFIAPDESYIIWDSIRKGGYGASDLYISFRTADDTWGPAINLGDRINTGERENYPSISPDGRFLFFDRRATSGNIGDVDIYWVDAQFIETLRPEG